MKGTIRRGDMLLRVPHRQGYATHPGRKQQKGPVTFDGFRPER
jgi:hypothetical protein